MNAIEIRNLTKSFRTMYAVDHLKTGEETVVEGFDNLWQIIGTVSSNSTATSESAAMSMGLTTMCNINLLYIIVAVLVNIFVSEDFRSGYAKNLFTVRAKKSDYVISKTLVCFAAGILTLAAFFAGSLIGGAVSGLPFAMEGFDVKGLIMCMISKILLISVFISIYLTMSVIAKQKLWLSILLSLGVSTLLFMMVPMLTPLNSTIINVIGCLAGGILFSFGLGAVSNNILKKTSLI